MNNIEQLLNDYYFEENDILRKKLLENIDDKITHYYSFSLICVDTGKRYLACQRDLEKFGKQSTKKIKATSFIKYLDQERMWYDIGCWLFDPEIFNHGIILDSDEIILDDSFKILKIKRDDSVLNNIFSLNLEQKDFSSLINKKFYEKNFCQERIFSAYKEFEKTKNVGKFLGELRVCVKFRRE